MPHPQGDGGGGLQSNEGELSEGVGGPFSRLTLFNTKEGGGGGGDRPPNHPASQPLTQRQKISSGAFGVGPNTPIMTQSHRAREGGVDTHPTRTS